MLAICIAQYTLAYATRITELEPLPSESLESQTVSNVMSIHVYPVTSNEANANTLKALRVQLTVCKLLSFLLTLKYATHNWRKIISCVFIKNQNFFLCLWKSLTLGRNVIVLYLCNSKTSRGLWNCHLVCYFHTVIQIIFL